MFTHNWLLSQLVCGEIYSIVDSCGHFGTLTALSIVTADISRKHRAPGSTSFVSTNQILAITAAGAIDYIRQSVFIIGSH